ncbi:MAG TPA: extracellular solute-binding protein [Chloroflexota bacterium]
MSRFKIQPRGGPYALLVLLLVACGPAANPSTSVPAAAPAASKPVAGAAPAPAGITSDQAAAPEGWDQLVVAAKQEGRLVFSGPPGELWRKGLAEAFQAQYPEINVDYDGGNSRDFWPRVFQERQGGQYLWDLRVGGPDPQVYQARDEGVLAAVKPLLVLPEVTDDSRWFGGFDAIFADKEHTYLPGFEAFVDTAVWLNKDVVPPAQFHRDLDILNPQWKGKIVLQDPRGGAGLGLTTVLYVKHGEQFIRDLFSQQDIVVTGDGRQQAEWVVRGRYPIAIGLNNDVLALLEQSGVKANVDSVEEGAWGMSIGFGGIQLLNRAPNPNAAKLYVNWLLTQPAQAQLAELVRANSRRTDVPAIDPSRAVDASRLPEYVPHQLEEYLAPRQQVQELARELLKSQ